MKRLVLFDMDHTLVSGSTAHAESFRLAFAEVYGIEGSIRSIDTQGKSDRRIIREVLRKEGLDDARIDERLDECIRCMVEHYHHLPDSPRPERGVAALLDALSHKEVLLGLVTGNLEEIAHRKLSHAGLADPFVVGGYGSDGEERAELVRIAVRRARSEHGLAADARVVVIGDTPRDVEAATANGCEPIGVATGRFSVDDLHKAGATRVFSNLRDTDAVVEVLIKG